MTQTRLETATGGPNRDVAKWPREKLGRVCVIVRGSSPRPKGDARYYGGNVPRLMVEDCTRDGIYVTPRIDFLTDEGAKLSRPMAAGDVVIVVSGNPGLPAILAVDCCIHDGFVGLRQLNKDKVSAAYLYHYLSFIKSHTDSQATGAIFRNLTTDQIANVEILLPSLADQQRIEERLREQLAEVAKARTAVQAQLAAAQAFPAALLRDVFDHPENRNREIKRLGEALRDIEAGKCMSCVERRAGPNEWGVLKVSAVTWGTFRPEENKVLPPDFVVPTEHEVQSGDFLISRSNTTELVGAVVLVRETRPKLMLSDKTLRLVLNEDVVAKEYLEWALRTSRCRDFIEQNSTGTSGSMKNITQDSIRNIPLALPTLDEQRTIATRLAAELAEVTRLRESLSGKLETLDRLPAALLAQAFQGGR